MSKVIISFLLFSTFCLPIFSQTKCDIANFFSAKDVSYDDIFVMTKSGDIEEVELVLNPLKLDAGTYKVEVTRKSSNLYKVDYQDVYIQTKYCSQFSYSEKAYIEVESSYGYSKGQLIFIE